MNRFISCLAFNKTSHKKKMLTAVRCNKPFITLWSVKKEKKRAKQNKNVWKKNHRHTKIDVTEGNFSLWGG